MRLSLLLEREPFGDILEDTMGDYWGHRLNSPVKITWKGDEDDGTLWRGNVYMNFFCVKDVDPACFEIIKREFSHSRSVWRTGLQAAYVKAAIQPPFRNWLSQVQFSVSEDIPHANEQLLVGGNRRIRIIHPSAGKSMVIHKKGFSKTGFEREIAARSGPAACVAPRFLGLEANGTAFAEEYFIGTPANRFSTGREEIVRSEARVRLISEVHRPTLRSTSLSDYLDKLNKEISAVSEGMEESTRRITDWIIETAGDCEIGLVFSHGDFQDANILVEGDINSIEDLTLNKLHYLSQASIHLHSFLKFS